MCIHVTDRYTDLAFTRTRDLFLSLIFFFSNGAVAACYVPAANSLPCGSAARLCLCIRAHTIQAEFGDISLWDTSRVKNFKDLFNSASGNRVCETFNEDISKWQTANVVSMSGSFRNCKAFNQNLNGWNVSSVTTFYFTFQDAHAFNSPLNKWHTSSVTSLYSTSHVIDQTGNI